MVEYKKHVHSVVRVRNSGKDGKSVMYRCSAPTCYFMAKREVLQGKLNVCPFCGGKHTLSWKDLSKSTPHCGCKNSVKIVVSEALLEMGLKNETE